MRRDIGDVGIVWSSGNSGERAVHRPISTRESQEIFTFTRVQSNARICNIFAIQAVTNRNHFHRQTKMPYLEETMEQEIILEARNITKVYPGGVVARAGGPAGVHAHDRCGEPDSRRGDRNCI